MKINIKTIKIKTFNDNAKLLFFISHKVKDETYEEDNNEDKDKTDTFNYTNNKGKKYMVKEKKKVKT